MSETRWESLDDQFVDAVERSELQHSPFDHIYMANVLPPCAYKTLLAEMPDRRFYHELRHQDAMRPDGHSTRLRMYLYPELLGRLPDGQRSVWSAVGRAFCSTRLESAFRRKFRTVLESRFGKPVSEVGLYPVPILLRDQPGYRIGIHADSPNKAITVQFYLPADERQQHLGTIFHERDRGEPAQRTTQMPFMPASGYAFPVSLTESWHSAARTSPGDGERVSMMVTYYVADDLPNKLKYRLRRAALRAGIHPKG